MASRLALTLLAIAGCATTAKPPVTNAPRATPAPPSLRLPSNARPERYRAWVRVSPDAEEFSATIRIDLTLTEATSIVWLNATGLAIDEAHFSSAGRQTPASAVAGGTDFLGFAVAAPIGPGPATLEIAYHGKASSRDDRGLFRQKEGGRWYAITQFEAIDARRLFPCFDEPAYKARWQLSLEVPADDVALSNTPVSDEKPGKAGEKTVTFVETAPLSSYLIAFAVGPFELVDAGHAGREKVPVRIAVPKGRAADARWAVANTGPALELLERYFDIAYPYPKLDMVAIPLPTSFGAMENAGMITIGQRYLLARDADDSIEFRRTYDAIALHELAHQWFGDLVTAAWWDDLWLNEAFADWIEGKMLDEWHPEWNERVGPVAERAHALEADSLRSARAVRQPIHSNDDIADAFDGITYAKGAAVLAMYEAWLGPETFQRGVRRYLGKHRLGNATAADLLGALGEESQRDVASSAGSLLDRPGAPLIAFELQCEGAHPSLAIAQQRYLPVGANGQAPISTDDRWQLPVCVRYPAGKSTERTCALLSDEKMVLALDRAQGCPAWILGNDGEIGYYRAAYSSARLRSLAAAPLSLPERVGLLDDLTALTEAARIPVGEALGIVAPMTGKARRAELQAVIALVRPLSARLVGDELRPRYARLVRELFGTRAHALGWTPRPRDDEETLLLRPLLLEVVADEGEDRGLREEAVALAGRWIDDKKAVSPDLVNAMLHTAAITGDRALFDRLRAAARKSDDRRERMRILEALGEFRSPALLDDALGLMLSDEHDPREAFRVATTAARNPSSVAQVWRFVRDHFDALAARLPETTMADLPRLTSTFCDERKAAEVEEFLTPRAPHFQGGPRELAQSLEEIRLCAAYRAAQSPSFTDFLATHP
jgi:alanyl aminopeptidase